MNEIAYQRTSDRLAKLIEEEKPKSKKDIAVLLGFNPAYISMMLNVQQWNSCPAHAWKRVLHWINMDMHLEEFAAKYPYGNKPTDTRLSDKEVTDTIDKLHEECREMLGDEIPDSIQTIDTFADTDEKIYANKNLSINLTEESFRKQTNESITLLSANISTLVERLNGIDINVGQLKENAAEDLKYLFCREKELGKDWDTMRTKIKETNVRISNIEEDNIGPKNTAVIANLANRVEDLENINNTRSEISKIVTLGEWQLCPKCCGTGTVFNYLLQPGTAQTYGPNQCDVCNGAKIIVKPVINQ